MKNVSGGCRKTLLTYINNKKVISAHNKPSFWFKIKKNVNNLAHD